jgi:hypothetical protein
VPSIPTRGTEREMCGTMCATWAYLSTLRPTETVSDQHSSPRLIRA